MEEPPCPAADLDDWLQANHDLDEFVRAVKHGPFPMTADPAIFAIMALGDIQGCSFDPPNEQPMVMKLIFSDCGHDFRLLARNIPAFQRKMNYDIAKLGLEEHRALQRDMCRLTATDDEVPF